MTQIAFTPRMKAAPSRGALGVKAEYSEPNYSDEFAAPEFFEEDITGPDKKKQKGKNFVQDVKRKTGRTSCRERV